MNKDTLKILSRGANTLNLEVEMRADYIGRCMTKATCAVVIERTSTLVAIAAAGAAEMGQDHPLLEEYLEDLKGIRFDNMGLGMVAY